MLTDDKLSDYIAQVFEQYQKSYDLEVAANLVSFESDEDKAQVLNDKLLHALCERHLASFKEGLMLGMIDIAQNAAQDGVRLSAIKDLGKMLYTERFKEEPQIMRHTNADGSNLPSEITIKFVRCHADGDA